MFWRDVLLAIGREDDVEEAGLHQLVHDLDAVPAEKRDSKWGLFLGHSVTDQPSGTKRSMEMILV